jgi:hypothetical protein
MEYLGKASLYEIHPSSGEFLRLEPQRERRADPE